MTPVNIDDDRIIVAAAPSSTRSYPDDSQLSKPEAKQQEMLMETIQADAVADRQSRLPNAEVVSKAHSQASSNITLLKNAGIVDPSSRLRRRSSFEPLLCEELDAERQGSSVLHEQVEEL
ncbi:hypothetical protein C2845_PM05G20040 [Panicum miliaceum]|uniref:Uncharacterized protein n=1 Tax=Panicum miliaceum TaxID=4540 RepID=A0A3L6SWV6_PANMI|nr:hypothetical protein C2845_PM05G20040 [Panicum miliaceum]